MKLHVMSDLHLEMRSSAQFTQQVLPGGDILVLAGDITYLRFVDQAVPLFKEFCAKYRWVFYVPGNHEFYKSSVSQALGVLSEVEKIPNLVVLKAGDVTKFEGKRILGGPMWFRDHPMNVMYEGMLNDFNQIRDYKPWVYEENQKFLDFLQRELKEGDIVVTHYLPTPLSTPERFRGDSTDRFFLCDVSNLIAERQPALWIHGHTHDPCDYLVGNTRVYCNPLGYPSERSNPDWKKRIEIDV